MLADVDDVIIPIGTLDVRPNLSNEAHEDSPQNSWWTRASAAPFIREGVVTDVSASVDEGPDIVMQKLVGGRQAPIPDSWLSNVTNTTGVRVATPRVWGYSDVGSGSLLTVMGVNATEYGGMMGAVGTDVLDTGRFLNET